MKISELAKRTDVPKQTIHYYIRSGLLPKPKKLGSNSAEYDESYVERIRLIKELKNDFFFPLPTIRKILWEHRGASKQALLKIRSEYFRPVEQYLGSDAVGDEAFLQASGLAARWLPKLKEMGIISSRVEDGQNVYTQDDITIAKVLVKMAQIGINRGNNFQAEVLAQLARDFREIVKKQIEEYRRTSSDLNPKVRENLAVLGNEVMGVLFYHLYRKFAREEQEANPVNGPRVS